MSAQRKHLLAILAAVVVMTVGYALRAVAYGIGGRPWLCAIWVLYAVCLSALVVYLAVTVARPGSRQKRSVETYRSIRRNR